MDRVMTQIIEPAQQQLTLRQLMGVDCVLCGANLLTATVAPREYTRQDDLTMFICGGRRHRKDN